MMQLTNQLFLIATNPVQQTGLEVMTGKLATAAIIIIFLLIIKFSSTNTKKFYHG